MPTSQLAFFEDTEAHLNVVVAHTNDVVTLLRLPLSSFADGSTDALPSHYRSITTNVASGLTTRFIGPYVLVGASSSWDAGTTRAGAVVVTRWAGESSFALTLNHGVERIESMGADAIVVGTGEHDLSMTAIRLGAEAAIAGTLVQQDAFQSEHRSHGFFYREDTSETGLFGLPIVATTAKDDGGMEQSARILFVRNRALSFASDGTLDATAQPRVDDGCRASCWDWYGDTRPIFIEDRIFALLGYEIIEGRLGGRGVEEVQRLDFVPRTARVRQSGMCRVASHASVARTSSESRTKPGTEYECSKCGSYVSSRGRPEQRQEFLEHRVRKRTRLHCWPEDGRSAWVVLCDTLRAVAKVRVSSWPRRTAPLVRRSRGARFATVRASATDLGRNSSAFLDRSLAATVLMAVPSPTGSCIA